MQKYGGSSVADAEGIKRVARRIVATREAGDQVVVVVWPPFGDPDDPRLMRRRCLAMIVHGLQRAIRAAIVSTEHARASQNTYLGE